VEHSEEIIKNCPSCAGDKKKLAINCIDFSYSKKLFSIQRCEGCELHFTDPRPNENAIGKYYNNPDYVSHTDTSEGLLFKVYGLVKSYTLKQKRKLLEGLTNDKTILDYGAGTGDFSTELVKHNWDVCAFEPDPNARKKISKKNVEVKLIESLSGLSDSSRSVISLWHVLEHVHKLDVTLEHFARILKPNGTLIIAVPNHTSFDAGFYKESWAAYDVPRHLYHFNPNTLKPLIEKFGFSLMKSKPMWFDSFYVSLLSEQILGNDTLIRKPFGWCRALIVGTLSNLIALLNTDKCSSIIYIFRKDASERS